jgi:hypothetical protein
MSNEIFPNMRLYQFDFASGYALVPSGCPSAWTHSSSELRLHPLGQRLKPVLPG